MGTLAFSSIPDWNRSSLANELLGVFGVVLKLLSITFGKVGVEGRDMVESKRKPHENGQKQCPENARE